MFTVVNGRIASNGVPIHRIGVNCPDLMWNWLTGSITSTASVVYTTQARVHQTLADIAARNLGIIRFLVTGYRTKSFANGFVNNQAAFLSQMDMIVTEAENAGCLLIPSLFFSPALIPPYVSENLRQYGVTGSATQTTMATVVSVIVNRYKNSPAIAAWEFMNESDIRTTNPPSVPNYSTDTSMNQPASWTTADGWDNNTARDATTYFNSIVKAADPLRMTMSGHMGWRSTQDVKTNGILSFLNNRLLDDRTDTIGFHAYSGVGFYGVGGNSYLGMSSFLKTLIAHGRGNNKPVVIGEFGTPANGAYDGVTGGANCMKYITDYILDAEPDLAMAWAYSANPGVNTVNDFYMNAQDNLNTDMLAVLTTAAAAMIKKRS